MSSFFRRNTPGASTLPDPRPSGVDWPTPPKEAIDSLVAELAESPEIFGPVNTDDEEVNSIASGVEQEEGMAKELGCKSIPKLVAKCVVAALASVSAKIAGFEKRIDELNAALEAAKIQAEEDAREILSLKDAAVENARTIADLTEEVQAAANIADTAKTKAVEYVKEAQKAVRSPLPAGAQAAPPHPHEAEAIASAVRRAEAAANKAEEFAETVAARALPSPFRSRRPRSDSSVLDEGDGPSRARDGDNESVLIDDPEEPSKGGPVDDDDEVLLVDEPEPRTVASPFVPSDDEEILIDDDIPIIRHEDKRADEEELLVDDD